MAHLKYGVEMEITSVRMPKELKRRIKLMAEKDNMVFSEKLIQLLEILVKYNKGRKRERNTSILS